MRRFLHFCSNFYVKSNSGYSLPTLSSKKSSDHRSFFCVCLVKRTRTTVSSSNSASNMPVFNQGPHQRKQTPDLGDPRRKTQVSHPKVIGGLEHDFYFSYIWANYNDLTATSLESSLIREIIPNGLNSG